MCRKPLLSHSCTFGPAPLCPSTHQSCAGRRHPQQCSSGRPPCRAPGQQGSVRCFDQPVNAGGRGQAGGRQAGCVCGGGPSAGTQRGACKPRPARFALPAGRQHLAMASGQPVAPCHALRGRGGPSKAACTAVWPASYGADRSSSQAVTPGQLSCAQRSDKGVVQGSQDCVLNLLIAPQARPSCLGARNPHVPRSLRPERGGPVVTLARV